MFLDSKVLELLSLQLSNAQHKYLLILQMF